MGTESLIEQGLRWLALVAGGLSFGLAAVVLYLFWKLRKLGRAHRLPQHVTMMAVSHLGLTLLGCAWLISRITLHPESLYWPVPALLFLFIVSDAGLGGLLWNEYLRTLAPRDALTKTEAATMLAQERDTAEINLKALAEAATRDAERLAGRVSKLEEAIISAGTTAKDIVETGAAAAKAVEDAPK